MPNPLKPLSAEAIETAFAAALSSLTGGEFTVSIASLSFVNVSDATTIALTVHPKVEADNLPF